MGIARILVVEDESIVAMDIRHILTASGFEVVACVASGEEAVARAGELRPDLALMDIRLQGEMNGIDAARRIREAYQIPTLFLTSYVDQEMLDQAKGLDTVGYVLKPFEERELCVAVEMALHRMRMEAGLRQALRAATDGRPAVGEAGEGGAPVLQFHTLGRLELVLDGRVVVRAEDLSRTLRNLLGLVVASPQLWISQEEVQLALWPESTPVKARSSFDSLLLRLRRTLDGLLEPHSIRNYLALQRGILRLNNCRVDAQEFMAAARNGLEQLKRRNPAPATEFFSSAISLWEGPFSLGASGVERLHDFHDQLERMYVEIVLRWSELLAARRETATASQLLTRALACDRTNDALVKALCNIFVAEQNLGKAGEVVRQYEEALRRAGFSPREIRGILADIIPSR
jgi:DNA-binding response OmpR family regulator